MACFCGCGAYALCPSGLGYGIAPGGGNIANWGSPSGPLPPLNAAAQCLFGQPSCVDIRWDDPALLALNSKYVVLGVNIYRSDVSDRGPYYRLNDNPISGLYYRDCTTKSWVSEEIVDWTSSWESKGDAPGDRRWVFRTQYPIIQSSPYGNLDTPTYANNHLDVIVTVDGVAVPVESVFGRGGQVKLVNVANFDDATERYGDLPLPLTASSVVRVSYFRLVNHVPTGLDLKTFYRVTTVAVDPSDTTLILESPLVNSPTVFKYNVEQINYIWREAVRRNHWILQQGGERVKLFIARRHGCPCPCMLDEQQLEYKKQPRNECVECFGTGFVGGYEGPYDILVAPDDAPSAITQTDRGRHKEKSQDVWITASPIVSQRDFIVKQTGERFSIGAIHRPTARGVILQQHFNISYLDQTDIIYRVPLDGTDVLFRQVATRYAQWPLPYQPQDGDTTYYGDNKRPVEPPYPEGPEARWPEVTDKANIDEQRRGRGRTGVWENETY